MDSKYKLKRGDMADFLYIDSNGEKRYFENVRIDNSYHEEYLASPKPMYYFMNKGGSIQCVHIEEKYVWPANNPASKILYGR